MPVLSPWSVVCGMCGGACVGWARVRVVRWSWSVAEPGLRSSGEFAGIWGKAHWAVGGGACKPECR